MMMRVLLSKLAFCLVAFFFGAGVGPAQAEFLPRTTAILQGLDKITARITQLKVPVGERVVFGSLEVHVEACFSTPPTEPPESAAFVQIREYRNNVLSPVLLGGWIYASSPAIHALEHPIYDIWVKNCLTSEGAPASDTPLDPALIPPVKQDG